MMPAKSQKGFTLFELILVLTMIGILIGTVCFVFTVNLRIWGSGYSRADIRDDLKQASERMVRELRHAKSIDAFSSSSVTVTCVDFESATVPAPDASYRYYLYNADDPEPNPPYSQASYELRRAKNSGLYGAGVVLARDIENPAAGSFTPFSQSGDLIIIDLSVARGQESIRLRSNVRPRNL